VGVRKPERTTISLWGGKKDIKCADKGVVKLRKKGQKKGKDEIISSIGLIHEKSYGSREREQHIFNY